MDVEEKEIRVVNALLLCTRPCTEIIVVVLFCLAECRLILVMGQ